MKILLISFDFNWGGVQEYFVSLTQGLLKQSNIEVIHLVKEKSFSSKRFLEIFENYKNYKLKTFSFFSLKDFINLFFLLKQVDIIHINREHELWLAFLCRIIKVKAKIIFSQHIKPNKKRFCLNFCDKITVNSNYIRKCFEVLYNKKYINKISLLYPSISNLPKLKEAPYKINGFPSMLMSGAYWKNQEKLLYVLKRILKEKSQAKLYYIGPSQDQKLLSKLKEKIKTLKLENNVEILDPLPREQALSLINIIDFYVYSFTEEPFGISILEACLLNKTIIAFKGGGINEILENYNKSYLIKAFNYDEFAQTLIKIYNNQEYKKMANLELLKEKFSFEKMLESHLTLYSFI